MSNIKSDIEVEIRSFVSEATFKGLVKFFKAQAKLISKDNQITHYFDCKRDLRIQKNDHYAKVWLKKGQLHDEQREEVEIKCAREDFAKLEKLFIELGYKTQIVWFRKRLTFKWNDISVMLDDTKGYGYIIELEKMSNQQDKDRDLELLKGKLVELGIDQTPKREFDKKFKHYSKNWKTLTH